MACLGPSSRSHSGPTRHFYAPIPYNNDPIVWLFGSSNQSDKLVTLPKQCHLCLTLSGITFCLRRPAQQPLLELLPLCLSDSYCLLCPARNGATAQPAAKKPVEQGHVETPIELPPLRLKHNGPKKYIWPTPILFLGGRIS